MSEPRVPFLVRLREFFAEAAELTAPVWGGPLLFIQEQMTRDSAYEKEIGAARKNDNALMRAAMKEAVLAHPAAGDAKALGKAADPEVLDLVLGRLSVRMMTMLLSAREESQPSLSINAAGDLVDGEGTTSEHFLRQTAEMLGEAMNLRASSGYVQKLAPHVWNWTYNLAASGEAPHLFPGMEIARGQNDIVLRMDPSRGHDTPREEIFRLWRADKDAAVAKRVAARPFTPGPV
jgi:hypothetical protein